jgi:hypothetical protein
MPAKCSSDDEKIRNESPIQSARKGSLFSFVLLKQGEFLSCIQIILRGLIKC